MNCYADITVYIDAMKHNGWSRLTLHIDANETQWMVAIARVIADGCHRDCLKWLGMLLGPQKNIDVP